MNVRALAARLPAYRSLSAYSTQVPREPQNRSSVMQRRSRRTPKTRLQIIDANQPYDYKTVEMGDDEDPPVKGSFTRRAFGDGTITQIKPGEDEPINLMFNPYSKEKHQCILCKYKVKLDYKNTRLLQQFVSSFSGRVYDRHVTGLCDAQQKLLLQTIATSRKAGYMPIFTKDPKFLKDPKLFDPLRPIRQHSYD